MKYVDFFRSCIESKKTYLCVGIDPDPGKLPAIFDKTPDGIYRFAREVIEVTQDLTPAYKFNLAFFEVWGWRGWQILERLINEMPGDVLLIGDAKRGDIGNSSKFYAEALLKTLKFHAVTLSPYLGSESIQPFLVDETKGAFVLCVTSNPSGRELQNHGGVEPLYLKTAMVVEKLNGLQNAGLVMGSTKPEMLLEMRARFPKLPFLIPGVGTQGGEVETAVQVCRVCGLGLINVSRGILYPGSGTFPENVRLAAELYHNKLKIYPKDPFGKG